MSRVLPLEVSGYLDNSNSPNISLKVEILLPTYIKVDEERITYPFDMLFTYSKVKRRLGRFFRNWFGKQEILEPIYDLFFASTFNNTATSPIQSFLSYVQALETYHQRTKKDYIDPAGVDKKRRKVILKTCPPKYRKWLGEKLAFSNSPTLDHRLRELIEMNPNQVNGMAGSHDMFIQIVKDTRNYYTHYDIKKRGKAATGGRLTGLSRILGIMVEGFLLYEMGFKIPEIQKIQFERHRFPQAWL